MGWGRAYAGPSCPKLEVVLLGWECGGGSWLGLGSWWRLALSLALLASVPDRSASARVSSSLSTTHHVHHFHNKHGTVPIAINRMPFLTRGGHVRFTASVSTLISPALPSVCRKICNEFSVSLSRGNRAGNPDGAEVEPTRRELHHRSCKASPQPLPESHN
ncbi:Neurexin-2-beta [Anabarilius grahami]|uniref:Neurexin-2-beta n=1 Tax=Anabarilius grahami TaxID=495550 RepID=A0A3N0YPD4_ANAGA|nr:Neurexin-2-beta [Anabarilius grahami]